MNPPSARSRLSEVIAGLRRRRVFQVLLVYVAVAWLLIQVADTVLRGLGLPEWTLTLVIVLLGLGLPLTLALAWVFEIGAGGIERTPADGPRVAPSEATAPAGSEAAAVQGHTNGPARVAGVAGTGTPAASRSAPTAHASPPRASVAVLPFVNLSSDVDQEYFADGLTEELLNVLAQVPGLRVPARTSSFAFKGKNSDIREIGQKLSVRTVLEGSVRSSGSRILITAQLIDVEDGFHLWSDTFKRDLEDIFEVQEEIARSIVETLKGRLVGEAETPRVPAATGDPQAYQLYLRGQHLQRRFEKAEIHKAVSLYEEATRRDPTFARAWAALGDCFLTLAYRGDGDIGERMSAGKEAAERAIALTPTLADGYVTRARHAVYRRSFGDAEQDLHRALELNSRSAPVHNLLGLLMLRCCRPEEAIGWLRKAAELDPLWLAPPNNIGVAYGIVGRYQEALTAYEQVLELEPMSETTSLNIAGVLSELGRHTEAIELAKAVHGRIGSAYTVQALIGCLAEAGQRGEAERLFEELRAQLDADPLMLAEAYLALGRQDESLASLNAAIASGIPAIYALASEGGFDPLREDPRWDPLLARAGFAQDVIRRGRELYARRQAAREAAAPVAARVPPELSSESGG